MSGDYFYEGSDYGFDPEYGGFAKAYSGELSKNISIATDVRMANQLKAVSEKLNTGATAIEIATVSPDIFESIPKEHFDELNRLRKLVGRNVELTLHAPLVEPTGLTKRGWAPYEREQSERQMIDAVEKAHKLNPEGNVVTTFHASVTGLPAEVAVWEGKEGEKKKVLKEAVVIDESTGNIAQLPLKPSPFLSEKKNEVEIKEKISHLNEKNWYDALHHLDYATEQGETALKKGFEEIHEIPSEPKETLLNLYKDYVAGKSEKSEKELKRIEEKYPEIEELGSRIKDSMHAISYGDINLRQAYNNLRELFDQTYHSLESSGSKDALEEKQKLDEFRAKIAPRIQKLNEPGNVKELAETVRDGIRVLRSVEAKQIPQVLKPLKDFTIEKSAETFSNVALASYKEFGEHSPVLSLENPPYSQALITSGEDLRKLVDESRKKFKRKAMENLGLSESKAEEEAEKLIGATWDLGHINMIRKYGAGAEEIKEETRKIAPVLKHIHLSDNFGLEHTELPMGMGNVPKDIFKVFKEEGKNLEKVKKVIEAGQWYQHFQTTPFGETLRAFGSPIYSGGANQYLESRGYFAGYGANPEIHHSMYGAGFANLPVELGGQMAGRSRLSGAPLE
jgi:sugar phosphate isomerase/epimerase